jgi:hypothetical protein
VRQSQFLDIWVKMKTSKKYGSACESLVIFSLGILKTIYFHITATETTPPQTKNTDLKKPVSLIHLCFAFRRAISF